jgi:hypothetical protein
VIRFRPALTGPESLPGFSFLYHVIGETRPIFNPVPEAQQEKTGLLNLTQNQWSCP